MEHRRVRVYKEPWSDALILSFLQHDGEKTYLLHPSGEWKEIKANEAIPEGSDLLWRLPRYPEWAQMLVDALYEEGIRPKAPIPSNQELARMEKHLEDMRAIVAKQLKMTLPTS